MKDPVERRSGAEAGRGFVRVVCWVIAVVVLPAWGCVPAKSPSDVSRESAAPVSPFQFTPAEPSGSAEVSPPRKASGMKFRDVHREARLEHVYVNGEKGKCRLWETTGGGAGWLDFDADGHWDLYLNQGGDATAEPGPGQPADRLFRNRGDGTFEDVTSPARIAEFGYSQGVAVGDYDNDGFDDVYVTNLSGNTLFHNQGDGTFVEVTGQAGVRDGRWSASAAWADLDLDGNLDLYVCNYCVFDRKEPKDCKNDRGELRICHPRNVPPWPDEFFVSKGDGTFSAEFAKRGFGPDDGRGLGVAVADFNNDGLPDIYVTNDTTANFLFLNEGAAVFRESALVMGCAADGNGNFQASMGVAVCDIDRNGWLDIYSTSFEDEYNSLYANYPDVGFQDVTAMFGLGSPTLDRLTFGAVMNDFDQDGRPDLVVSCGHIENHPGFQKYRMFPQAFTLDGQRFREYTAEAGDYFRAKWVGRAIATCDYDEDGDLDLLVVHENDPAALLRNESERGHWLKFAMRGRQSNRRGINARVTVKAGDATFVQELCGGASYCGTHQPVLVFGLGAWSGPCTATIRWPSGRVQSLENLAVDKSVVFDESEAGARKIPQ